MAKRTLKFEGNSKWLREEAQKLKEAEKRVKRNMQNVTRAAFEDAQATIHKDSGALAASGKWSVDVDPDNDIVATIGFGGGEVDYAIYELNAKGHKTVDQTLLRFEEAYESAIREGLTGE